MKYFVKAPINRQTLKYGPNVDIFGQIFGGIWYNLFLQPYRTVQIGIFEHAVLFDASAIVTQGLILSFLIESPLKMA